ncbi:hypothetical protein Arub01_42620 [Actinomadura rubrobrunea]|uniref:HTH merR-type domain-containing protein n=1 Tax=Actinomadura rubrobrunea TaxID=115335 RepID=A0A9W6UXE0_9ACTN|nr:MerR family transcriptional regulator [Actinomadura rubrobrunea]GLW66018.1 hypothetical protein Arub01_42620 [Actinomadura rubrobrunea]
MSGTWTISELAERAVAALSAGDPLRVSGRVRDLPNERLIRWYTTIGLVDPPLGRRGRTAVYGHRHLLQIVAVKRRQAAGRTIAEIQQELSGATDDTLRAIAQIPDPLPDSDTDTDTGTGTGTGAGAEPAQARGRFWTARPAAPSGPADVVWRADIRHARDSEAPAAPSSPAGAAPSTPPTSGNGETRPGATPTRPGHADETPGRSRRLSVVQGVRLAPGVTVLLDAPALGEDDLAAIAAAAGPLLDELRRRGLLDPIDTHPHPSGRP